MRVLLITPSYFPIVGGSEVLTRVLATKLNSIGVAADIMTFNMNKKWNPIWKEEVIKEGSSNVFKEAAFDPLPRLPNPLSNILRVNVIPKLSFTKKFSKYDIIHFIGETDLSFPIFSSFIKKPKLLQCVAIYKEGGIYKYYTSQRAFLGKSFKRLFSHVANRFIIASSEEKKLLLDLFVPENKITALPIGVDTDLFHPNPAGKLQNMLLFVGRLSKIKGLHILLKALQYVNTPVKLVVIGPPWELEYVEEIEKLSQEINSTGFHEVCLLGELSTNNLIPWYQKATILVCPFTYELHSNVVREALACGTPVVSTGRHLVEGCSDGISISPKNPKDLAKVINNLLENPQLCDRLGKAGRQIVEQCFSWDSVVARLVEIYAEMLKEYSKPLINDS